MDDSERDQRDVDEEIVSARIAGASLRELARQHPTVDIEAAIDRRLNYELDNRQRLRLVKLSTERILSLMKPFYEKAVRDLDCAAGTLVCRLEERLALLLGLDHPTTQRVDVYQVEQQHELSDHERIKRAILGMARGNPDYEPKGNGKPPEDPHGSDSTS